MCHSLIYSAQIINHIANIRCCIIVDTMISVYFLGRNAPSIVLFLFHCYSVKPVYSYCNTYILRMSVHVGPA
jgi:hypothetical protein